MQLEPFARLATFSVLLAGSIGCSGADDPPPPSGDGGPVAKAYAALTAGEIERAAELTAALDARVQEAPTEGMATFYSGLMRFWRFAEAEPDPGVTLSDEMTTIVERISGSRGYLPNDARVPGFLGLTRTLLAMFKSDQAGFEQADRDLRDSIQMLPAYGYFLRATAKGYPPASSVEFQTAISDLGKLTEACGYKQDASGSFEYLAGPQDYQHHVCNNEGMVPHVFEGVFLTYGDYALKAGFAPDKVRAIYSSAKNSPTYATWPYASELEKRLDQVDARAALYADQDPLNDPPLWTATGQVCVGCHQKK
jgi:hypothetical protein